MKIEFRGKLIEAKVNDACIDWFYGDLVRELSSGKTYILDVNTTKNGTAKFSELGLEVQKETVGQYIGLKDKNGTKIYVGDIIEYKGSYGVVKFGIDRTDIGFHVHWDDENEDLGKFGKRKDILFWIQQRELSVIGNIHENKELLEGEQNE